MNTLLSDLIESNSRYAAIDTDLNPDKRQQRIDTLAAEDQLTDGEVILKRLFYSPVGFQSLDHLLSCWRPGKGRGWTDDRVLRTLHKLMAAGLVMEEVSLLRGQAYRLTQLAYQHYSELGRQA